MFRQICHEYIQELLLKDGDFLNQVIEQKKKQKDNGPKDAQRGNQNQNHCDSVAAQPRLATSNSIIFTKAADLNFS